jgi:peptide/nickel transport system permease protein
MLTRLIVRRLIFLIFVLFGLSLITFGLSHIIPGDPARLMAGPRAGKSAVAKIREQYGLNDPLPEQYVTCEISPGATLGRLSRLGDR